MEIFMNNLSSLAETLAKRQSSTSTRGHRQAGERLASTLPPPRSGVSQVPQPALSTEFPALSTSGRQIQGEIQHAQGAPGEWQTSPVPSASQPPVKGPATATSDYWPSLLALRMDLDRLISLEKFLRTHVSTTSTTMTTAMTIRNFMPSA